MEDRNKDVQQGTPDKDMENQKKPTQGSNEGNRPGQGQGQQGQQGQQQGQRDQKEKERKPA